MKKKNLIILSSFLLLFGFFGLFINQKKLKGDEECRSCDLYGTEDPCKVWYEYECPDGTSLGGDVNRKRVEQFCEPGDECCSDGRIEKGGSKYYKTCGADYYCDTNASYFCSIRAECEATTSALIAPSDNSTKTLPLGLDWCDSKGIDSLDNEESYYVTIEKDVGTSTPIWSHHKSVSSKSSRFCFIEDTKIFENWGWDPIETSDLTSGNTYRWSVDSINENRNFYLSEGNNFNTNQPDIKKIEGGKLTYDNYYKINEQPFQIDWQYEENAKSYYIKIIAPNNEEVFYSDYTTATKSPWITLKKTIDKYDNYYLFISSCEKEDGKRCGRNCCLFQSGHDCSRKDYFYLQTKNSSIDFTDESIKQIEIISPSSRTSTTPEVNINSNFSWTEVEGASSYELKIDEVTTTYPTSSPFKLENIWGYFNPEEKYDWSISPCENGPDSEEKECSINEDKSPNETSSSFKLPKITPTLISPGPEKITSDDVIFRWKRSKAQSYKYEIEDNDGNVTGSTISNYVNHKYQENDIGETYYWKIKGCNGKEGDYCEDSWQTKYFTISEFNPPTNLDPENGSTFYSNEDFFSWDQSILGEAYEIKVFYEKAATGTEESCLELEGSEIMNTTTTSSQIRVPENMDCLGDYEFTIKSHFYEDCSGISSDWISSDFTYKNRETDKLSIMPCNARADNINTEWNETDRCQLKHVPILFFNIADFLLWKASIVVFILLIIFSAVTSFASAGLPIKTVSLKAIWVGAGKGYAVMFLAWTFLTFILRLIGITDSLMFIDIFNS